MSYSFRPRVDGGLNCNVGSGGKYTDSRCILDQEPIGLAGMLNVVREGKGRIKMLEQLNGWYCNVPRYQRLEGERLKVFLDMLQFSINIRPPKKDSKWQLNI